MSVLVEHCRRPRPVSGKRVYIGRPGLWGNPFAIGKDGGRAEVIEKYRVYLAEHPELVDALRAEEPAVLACWCYPQTCHGDVLIAALLDQQKEQG